MEFWIRHWKGVFVEKYICMPTSSDVNKSNTMGKKVNKAKGLFEIKPTFQVYYSTIFER